MTIFETIISNWQSFKLANFVCGLRKNFPNHNNYEVEGLINRLFDD